MDKCIVQLYTKSNYVVIDVCFDELFELTNEQKRIEYIKRILILQQQ